MLWGVPQLTDGGIAVYYNADLLARLGDRELPPIVCNTSLNFSGRGFINRLSDLLRFCDQRGIDHAVVDGHWYAAAR